MLANWLLTSLSVVAASSLASAQCRDFSADFGLPGGGLTGQNSALCVFDDGSGPALYAAGSFANYGTARVVRWNGSQWTVVATNGGFDAVQDMCVWNDGGGARLYVVGSFQTVDGVAAKRIAAWDGANWTEVGGGLNSIANAVAVHDDGSGPKLIVAGEFTLAGSTPCTRVASWDGTQWNALGSQLTSRVHCLLTYDDGAGPKLYAGGAFVGKVQRWDGASWSQLAGAVLSGDAVYALTSFDEGFGPRLIAGGDMTLSGNYGDMLRWNGVGWSALGVSNAYQPTLVKALAVFDDGTGPKLFAGADFGYGSLPNYGALVSWNGASWAPVSIGVKRSPSQTAISDFAVFDDGSGTKLFVAGGFTAAGENPSSNIARWGDPCTAPIVTLQPQSQTAIFDGSGAPITFEVAAVGAASFTYQWRHDGAPLADAPQRIAGANTKMLRIFSFNLNDAGEYDCVITNPIGAITSASATLTIPVSPAGYPVEVRPLLVPPVVVANLPGNEMVTQADFATPTGPDEFIFRATVTNPTNATPSLCRQRSGVVDLVLQNGDPAPGCEPSAVFGTLAPFQNWSAVSNTRFAVQGRLQNGAVPNGNFGIWANDGTNTVLTAREGEAAVGGAPGEIWRFFTPPVMSESGRVGFSGRFYLNGVSQGFGAWAWDATSGAQLLMRTGTQAPGTSALLTGLAQPNPVLVDAAGQVLVKGGLNSQTGYSYPVGQVFDSALWLGQPGALQLIARSGDPAPGFSAQDNLESIGDALLASNGDVWFTSWVAGPAGFETLAVFRWSQGVLERVMTRGDPAEGLDAGSTIWVPTLRAANDSGQAVVQVTLQTSCGSQCPSVALYRIEPNAAPLLVMANRTDPLPGSAPGATFHSLDTVAMNGAGQVALGCLMTLGSGGQHHNVFGWTAAQGLFPIAVSGAAFETAPGVFRTVSRGFLDEQVVGTSESASRCLDDSGALILTLVFTTEEYGIYEAQFSYLVGLQFGAGATVCSGDGTSVACPCGNTGAGGSGCLNSSGQGALVATRGTNRIDPDDLAFDAAFMPAGKSTLLFQGSMLVGGGAGAPFEDGVKCAGGFTRRFGVQSTSFAGEATWGPGLAPQGQWLAGETRFFQVWHRDIAHGACNKLSNMSNALSVTFVP